MDRYLRKTRLLGAALTGLALLGGAADAYADGSWSFGVMTDTQGSGHPDVQPNNVSTRLMEPVVDRFVDTHGVDMMISVGDLTGKGRTNEFNQWKDTAAPIYDANIPMYPTRGNHDVKTENFNAPVYDPLFGEQVETRKTTLWDQAFPYLDSQSNQFDPRLTAGPGASYTFEYNNTRFAAVDVYGARPVDLVTWMQGLKRGDDNEHMFVYGHEPFFGRARGGALGRGSTRDQFLQTLADNGIEAYLSGDHHQYNRSSFTNGTNKAELQHIITGSNAEKYYRFERSYDEPAEIGHRQINGEVGYSVATVKGPFVIFKHYSSPAPDPEDPNEVFNPDWRVADRWVHSTNGDHYAIAAGASYAGLTSSIDEGDGFLGTEAEILAGTNAEFRTLQTDPDSGSPVTERLGDNVNFGWAERDPGQISDVLWLAGLDDNLDGRTVPYALALGFDPAQVDELSKLRLMKQTENRWVAIEELIDGARETPIIGPYQKSYELGTFGINPETDRAWAVINREGQFAVGAIPEPATFSLMLIGAHALVRRPRRLRARRT